MTRAARQLDSQWLGFSARNTGSTGLKTPATGATRPQTPTVIELHSHFCQPCFHDVGSWKTPTPWFFSVCESVKDSWCEMSDLGPFPITVAIAQSHPQRNRERHISGTKSGSDSETPEEDVDFIERAKFVPMRLAFRFHRLSRVFKNALLPMSLRGLPPQAF